VWRTIQVLWLGSRLGAANAETRRLAAQKLSRLRCPAAIERLGRAVLDPDERVRITIIIALRDSQDRRAVAPLVEVLTDAGTKQQWAVWKEAARVLAEFRAVEAVEPIVSLFSESVRLQIPREVHDVALSVMGEIGDGRGVLVTLSHLPWRREKLPTEVPTCLRKIGPAAIDTLRAELLTRRWASIAEMLSLLDWKPSTPEERIIWALARA
jgi:HEAT repeat protein